MDLCIGVGNANILCTCNFLNHIVVCAFGIIAAGQEFECAVGICGLIQCLTGDVELIISRIQTEGEYLVCSGHLAPVAGEGLNAIDLDLCSTGGVGVFKDHRIAAVVVISNSGQCTIAVVCYRDDYGMFRGVIGYTGFLTGNFYDLVGMFTGFRIVDLWEVDTAICLVVADSNRSAVFQNHKGEIPFFHILGLIGGGVREALFTNQGDLGRLNGIDIGEVSGAHIACAGAVDRCQCNQLTVAGVSDVDSDVVFTGIVAHTAGTLGGNDFLKHIVVEAFLSVSIRKIHAERLCTIDRCGLNRRFIGDGKGCVCLKQIEGEALVSDCRPVAGKLLFAVEGYSHRLCLVNICKVQSIITCGRLDSQHAIFVADLHTDDIHASVVGKAVSFILAGALIENSLLRYDLLDVIRIGIGGVVFTQICHRVGDRREGECAVCLVGNLFDQLCAGIVAVQAEGELACGQKPVAGVAVFIDDLLLSAKHYLTGAGDSVGVHERCLSHSICLTELMDHRCGGNQCTVTVVGDGNDNAVFGRIIDHTAFRAGNFRKLIVISSGFVQQIRIGILVIAKRKGEITGVPIVGSIISIAAGQGRVGVVGSDQIEAEGLAVLQRATYQCLRHGDTGDCGVQFVGILKDRCCFTLCFCALKDNRGCGRELTVCICFHSNGQDVLCGGVGHTHSCGSRYNLLNNVGLIQILFDQQIEGGIAVCIGGDDGDGIAGCVALAVHGIKTELKFCQGDLYTGIVYQILMNRHFNLGAVDLVDVGKFCRYIDLGSSFRILAVRIVNRGVGVGILTDCNL